MRIPLGYPSSVEGETLEVDFYSEEDLDALLRELSIQ